MPQAAPAPSGRSGRLGAPRRKARGRGTMATECRTSPCSSTSTTASTAGRRCCTRPCLGATRARPRPRPRPRRRAARGSSGDASGEPRPAEPRAASRGQLRAGPRRPLRPRARSGHRRSPSPPSRAARCASDRASASAAPMQRSGQKPRPAAAAAPHPSPRPWPAGAVSSGCWLRHAPGGTAARLSRPRPRGRLRRGLEAGPKLGPLTTQVPQPGDALLHEGMPVRSPPQRSPSSAPPAKCAPLHHAHPCVRACLHMRTHAVFPSRSACLPPTPLPRQQPPPIPF